MEAIAIHRCSVLRHKNMPELIQTREAGEIHDEDRRAHNGYPGTNVLSVYQTQPDEQKLDKLFPGGCGFSYENKHLNSAPPTITSSPTLYIGTGVITKNPSIYGTASSGDDTPYIFLAPTILAIPSCRVDNTNLPLWITQHVVVKAWRRGSSNNHPNAFRYS